MRHRLDAVAATASVRATSHAIAATALSLARRDGPDTNEWAQNRKRDHPLHQETETTRVK